MSKKQVIKKIFVTASIAIVVAVVALCGCTPKAKTIWCDGVSGKTFSISYSVSDLNYNGEYSSFAVKDNEAFVNYLVGLSDYSKSLKMSNDGDQSAYIFEKDSNRYFVRQCGDVWYLSACRYIIASEGNSYYCEFPPIDFNAYNYDAIKNDNIINGEISTVQSWDYFKDFYANSNNATIDEATQVISTSLYALGDDNVCETIQLRYSQSKILYTITFQE